MIGRLSPEEIERVLSSQMIGRIGCHAGGRTYVVPVTYAYDGESIYGYTGEGMKLRMMRDNPEVCFEVEQIDDPSRWRSVIAWGSFEELYGQEAAHALQILLDRYAVQALGETALPPLGPHRRGAIHPDAHLYRVRLGEKTGRFESI
jgi:hypothetical protein